MDVMGEESVEHTTCAPAIEDTLRRTAPVEFVHLEMLMWTHLSAI